MQQKNDKEITVKELVDEIDIQPFRFLSALHRYLPDASEHRGRIDGRYSGSHQRASTGSGNERKKVILLPIQLFRILAANKKDICAALLMGKLAIALWKKIEKLVEDAVCGTFTMFPQNVNDIKYAYAFCINGCVGMIKWLAHRRFRRYSGAHGISDSQYCFRGASRNFTAKF